MHIRENSGGERMFGRGYGWGRGQGFGRKGYGLGRIIMAKLLEKGSVSLEEIQQELGTMVQAPRWTPGWRCWWLFQQYQPGTSESASLKDLERKKEELEKELEELKKKIEELKQKNH